MTLIRPDGSEGGTHERPGENKLGRSFGPVFENDGYLSPVHAMLDIRAPNGVVRDLELNGVFVKMTGEEELQSARSSASARSCSATRSSNAGADRRQPG